MNPSIKKIVHIYLMKKGYDGLYNDEMKCACLRDDLFPCECFDARNCKAGYKSTPPEGYEEAEYWIGPKKEM